MSKREGRVLCQLMTCWNDLKVEMYGMRFMLDVSASWAFLCEEELEGSLSFTIIVFEIINST